MASTIKNTGEIANPPQDDINFFSLCIGVSFSYKFNATRTNSYALHGIADHPPVETFPRFYLVLLRQPIAPMEADGMSRVYQM